MSLRIRRGGQTGGVPPPAPTFGPTNGRQSVIDAAGPRSVVAPAAPYVEITTANNTAFQTILNANPGARFWIRAGTYNRTTTLNPLSNQTLVFEPGAILDGGGTPGIRLIEVPGNRGGVTIRGGLFRNVGAFTDTPGILATENNAGIRIVGPGTGTPSIVEDCEITDITGPASRTTATPGIGVEISAHGTIMRYCYSHDNGRSGMAVHEPTLGALGANNVLLTHNHFARNKTNPNINPGGEAGTGKIIDGRNGGLNSLVFSHNYVHDESGFGVWSDYSLPSTTGMLWEENVIENCWYSGMFYEASGGGCRIRRNYVFGCGAGDATYPSHIALRWNIMVTCCDGTLGAPGGIVIENNIVSAINFEDRSLCGLINADWHPWDNKNITVQNNQFWAVMSTGGDATGVGGSDQQATKTLWFEPTIHFENNEYRIANMALNNWFWADSGGSAGATRDWATWQSYGFDQFGTRIQV